MSDKTGGPAFPGNEVKTMNCVDHGGSPYVMEYMEEGMTLRDYFSISILSAMIASGKYDGHKLYLARAAMDQADALITVLNEKEQTDE
jgi:hypothetical protein